MLVQCRHLAGRYTHDSSVHGYVFVGLRYGMRRAVRHGGWLRVPIKCMFYAICRGNLLNVRGFRRGVGSRAVIALVDGLNAYPNFFLVGPPRTGTTSFYNILRGIRGIYFPDLKEPKYFSHGLEAHRLKYSEHPPPRRISQMYKRQIVC